MASSIFGPLDKRQRVASDAEAATSLAAELSFEDRADLLNDLLEEDDSVFPLLSCPPEVLSGVLLLSDVVAALRIRPLCCQMRAAIDGNTGFWCSIIIRDFADMGGSTKHYRGLRTLADAWDDSKAFLRLEWDPLMICAPPALRYTLLAAGQARQRLWQETGGHSLAAGWGWFSSRVCRRMASATFVRWARLQYQEGAVRRLMGPLGGLDASGEAGASSTAAASSSAPNLLEGQRAGSGDLSGGMKFRRGRSDAVTLSAAAVSDIYETVQRWHNKAHCDMMRAHFGKDPQSGGACAGTPQGAGETTPGAAQDSSPGSFSVTPTLDAAEAAFFAADAEVATATGTDGTGGDRGNAETGTSGARGQASRRLEEAQLRLALELSVESAAAESAANGSPAQSRQSTAGEQKSHSSSIDRPSQEEPEKKGADPVSADIGAVKSEPCGLPLRAEGDGPAPLVFLKPHCLAERVEQLPESMEKSIEHIVNKMTKPSTWSLLYDSITEELNFRAKSAAHALCTAHAKAMDGLLCEDISLQQERMCLPIWKSSRELVTKLSRLRATDVPAAQRAERRELLRQAALEWCELEDLTEFLDSQLAPLELAIDNFRGEQEMSSKAHTPHIRDIGRLMFRNFCLLDSRLFRSICLAAYALVHEVHDSASGQGHGRGDLADLLDGVHAMLVGCDVADDDLSLSKQTKEGYVEHLVVPISAAVESFADWDVRGHPSRNAGRKPSGCRVAGDRRPPKIVA